MKNSINDFKDQAYTMNLDIEFWNCDFLSDDEKDDILGIFYGKELKRKCPWLLNKVHTKRYNKQMKKSKTEQPNPFLNENNEVLVRKALTRNGATITNYFLIETDSIISVYPKRMKELVQKLSRQTSALATVLHIITNMKCYEQSEHSRLDVMYVDLSFGVFKSKLGIQAKNTVNKVLALLTDNKLISRKNDTEYWVNHQYIFPGSRVNFFNNFYPDFIRVTHTK